MSLKEMFIEIYKNVCFIDTEKVFDGIRKEGTFKNALEKRKVDKGTIEIVQAMYKPNTNIVSPDNK